MWVSIPFLTVADLLQGNKILRAYVYHTGHEGREVGSQYFTEMGHRFLNLPSREEGRAPSWFVWRVLPDN